MKLYRCLWPNGDVSIVWANNKLHAIDLLDEVGGACNNDLEVLTDYPMAIHLCPKIDTFNEGDGDETSGDWALEGFDERTCDEGGPLDYALAELRRVFQTQKVAACLPCKGSGYDKKASDARWKEDRLASAVKCKGSGGKGGFRSIEEPPRVAPLRTLIEANGVER